MSSEDVYKEYSQRIGKAQQANQITKKTLLTNISCDKALQQNCY